MTKFLSIFAMVGLSVASVAVQAADKPAAGEAAVVARGKMLYSSDGARIASVNRVTMDGSPQLILAGRLVTVPASSVSVENGKLSTKLTRKEVLAIR